MNDQEMREFDKFEKSLPKRFKKLDAEIDEHMQSCWKCRNIPWYYHKDLKEKIEECNKILEKTGHYG
jgi:acetyl-CoA carboxylase beta subunit